MKRVLVFCIIVMKLFIATKYGACSKTQSREENDSESLQNQFHDLQNQLRGLQNQLKGVSNHVEGQQNQLQGLQNQLKGVNSQLEGQQSQLEGLQNQLKGVNSQLEGQQIQLEGLQNQLKGVNIQLGGQQNQLQDLQQNPVPIGFIYVQLSDQPQPSSLWPQTKWENISSQYAGLFFRVLGGDSAAFGKIQNDNSPRITEIRNHAGSGPHNIDVPANDDWSGPLWTGSDLWCVAPTNPCYWSMSFKQSGGEVRPRNQATQIWKRIE